MKITVELSDEDIRAYICQQIAEGYGVELTPEELVIGVKSENNFKPQEWEQGKLRVQVTVDRK